MKKQKTIGQLKRDADRVFSLWIRKRDKRCVTCGSRPDHAGHYVPRNWLGLRYNEVNVHAQCVSCNIFKKGAMDEYALFLKSHYGLDILDILKTMKVPKQFKRKDYERIIKKYQ